MWPIIGSIALIIFLYYILKSEYVEKERKQRVLKSVDIMMGVDINPHCKYTVTRVIDGDTLVLNNNITVRLAYIDAYESDHPMHPVIMTWMYQNILNRRVNPKFIGVDKYGRKLASIYCENGANLNEELVRLGYARIYEEYCNKASDEYVALKRAKAISTVYTIGSYFRLLNK